MPPHRDDCDFVPRREWEKWCKDKHDTTEKQIEDLRGDMEKAIEKHSKKLNIIAILGLLLVIECAPQAVGQLKDAMKSILQAFSL